MAEIAKTGKEDLDKEIKAAIEKLGYEVKETEDKFQTTKKSNGK